MRFLKYLLIFVIILLACMLFVLLKTHHKKDELTFSGAYLASYGAYSEKDMQSSVYFMKKAVEKKPNDNNLQKELLVKASLAGDMSTVFQAAYCLRNDQNLKPLSHLILAIAAIKKIDGGKQHYKKAMTLLESSSKLNIDNLLRALIKFWLAEDDVQIKQEDQILSKYENIFGTRLLIDYQRALRDIYIGKKEQAKAKLFAIIKGYAPKESIGDIYEHVFFVYARLLKEQNNEKAVKEFTAIVQKNFPDNVHIKRLIYYSLQGKKTGFSIKTPIWGIGEVLENMGALLAANNQLNLAQFYLELALFLNPNHGSALYNKGKFFMHLGSTQEAVNIFNKISENSVYYPEALLRLVLYYTDKKNEKLAFKALEKLEKSTDMDLQMRIASVGVYINFSKWEKAKDYVQKTLQNLSSFNKVNASTLYWVLYYQRGIIYEKLGLWPKAEESFNKALALSPDQADVLNYLGYSLANRGLKLRKATKLLEKAAQLAPNNAYILDSLGWAYYKTKHYDEAIILLEKAVEKKPLSAQINEHLGDVYQSAGRHIEARFQWQHALVSLEDSAKRDPSVEIKTEEERLKNKLKKTHFKDL